MKLIDDIAPNINLILRIFGEIKYFMVILAVIVFAFAMTFFLFGKNQVQFDEIEDFPEYSSLAGALWHIWTIFIGNPKTDVYNIDNYLAGKNAS